jgi:hypothetical protein
MGSVDIVLPSRDSARIVNPQIDVANLRTFLFTASVWVKKVEKIHQLGREFVAITF